VKTTATATTEGGPTSAFVKVHYIPTPIFFLLIFHLGSFISYKLGQTKILIFSKEIKNYTTFAICT
jgi:hypothetical protein